MINYASDIPPPFDAHWFLFILGFLIGAALGSFGTMLAYRLPRGMSIVSPGSHCPSCNAKLRAQDLVPLLSWLSTGGKCRYCHVPIGARYFWIELSCSVASGILSAVIGISPMLPALYLTILLCVVLITRKITKS